MTPAARGRWRRGKPSGIPRIRSSSRCTTRAEPSGSDDARAVPRGGPLPFGHPLAPRSRLHRPLAALLVDGDVGEQALGHQHPLLAAVEPADLPGLDGDRSEEHTSELQSLMRISYAVFCLKKKNRKNIKLNTHAKNK